jgi:hypothetical protein
MSRIAWADDFKRDDAAKPRKDGIVIEDRMAIKDSTSMISISVNPCSARRLEQSVLEWKLCF